MAEKTVQVDAATHLIIHPKRMLHVTLQLAASFACSWDLQISDIDGILTHQVQLPRLPVGFVWTLDDYLDHGQTIDIFASSYDKAGEDYISLEVNEAATLLIVKKRENDCEKIVFRATITDPPPLKRSKK